MIIKLRKKSKIAIAIAVCLSFYFTLFIILEMNLNMGNLNALSAYKEDSVAIFMNTRYSVNSILFIIKSLKFLLF